MLLDLFSLFPTMFESYLQESILKRAQQAGLLTVRVHNIRDWATDKHHVTDDTSYGGGGGMVMKPEPIFSAVESILNTWNPKSQNPNFQNPKLVVSEVEPSKIPIILLSPTGRKFNQTVAQELSQYQHLAFICGRYEGVDQRVRDHLATDEISIGDFVVTGGELPAMLIVDAVARHIPGVLGAENAVQEDSHASGLLEYPHYTRPPEFRGWPVPAILLSGDHGRIERWRREEALRRTFLRRPDMLLTLELSEADKLFLSRLAEEIAGGSRQ